MCIFWTISFWLNTTVIVPLSPSKLRISLLKTLNYLPINITIGCPHIHCPAPSIPSTKHHILATRPQSPMHSMTLLPRVIRRPSETLGLVASAAISPHDPEGLRQLWRRLDVTVALDEDAAAAVGALALRASVHGARGRGGGLGTWGRSVSCIGYLHWWLLVAERGEDALIVCNVSIFCGG